MWRVEAPKNCTSGSCEETESVADGATVAEPGLAVKEEMGNVSGTNLGHPQLQPKY